MKSLKGIKLFLLDLDGTVYLENTLIRGALSKINEMRQKASVCFLTNNSSKSADAYREKLTRFGICVRKNEIYTSGQATAEYLRSERPGKSVYLVGTKLLAEEFKRYGIILTQDSPDIVVLGYDTELTYDKLVKLTRFVSLGAELIATHPDINCPAQDVYVPDVGSFLKLVEASTGKRPSVIIGKPYREMGERILKRFSLQPNEVAMIGDRLSTDIRFAVCNGFISILVLSGETTKQAAICSDIKPDIVADSIASVCLE